MKIIGLSIELTKLQSAIHKTSKGTPCLLIPLDQKGIIQGAAEKGSRVYLDTTVGVFDEKNQFDQDVAAWLSQTKDEREAKADKSYIGNGKVLFNSDGVAQSTASPQAAQEAAQSGIDDDDDLPF